jgi:hypothetical protein
MFTTSTEPRFETSRLAPEDRSPLEKWFTAALRSLNSRREAAKAEAPRNWAQEAAALRAVADRYADTERGFAADLYAAADRHEQAGNSWTTHRRGRA